MVANKSREPTAGASGRLPWRCTAREVAEPLQEGGTQGTEERRLSELGSVQGAPTGKRSSARSGRGRRRHKQASLGFANCSFLNDPAVEHLAQENSDVMGLAEHRGASGRLDALSKQLKTHGWRSHLNAAEGTHGKGPLATSGGVGVLVRPHLVWRQPRHVHGLKEAHWGHLWKHPRFVAVILHFGSFTMLFITAYLHTGVRFVGENMALLTQIGCLIKLLALPFVMAADWQTPQKT